MCICVEEVVQNERTGSEEIPGRADEGISESIMWTEEEVNSDSAAHRLGGQDVSR
jgi:hypothetical protein